MTRRRSGFTLIELLVVIAIIAILAAILFPIFSGVKERARFTACQNNLSQIGKAMKMYGDDNNGMFPMAWEWRKGVQSEPGLQEALAKYVGRSEKIFACPSDRGDIGKKDQPYWKTFGSSYGFQGLDHYRAQGNTPWTTGNAYIAGLSQDNPVAPDAFDSTHYTIDKQWAWRLPLSKRTMVFDQCPWHFYNRLNTSDRISADGQNCVVMCDGHVKPMQYQDMVNLIFSRKNPF